MTSKGTIAGVATLAAVGALVATQVPEIKRYLNIRSM
jgi:hypothetical protein